MKIRATVVCLIMGLHSFCQIPLSETSSKEHAKYRRSYSHALTLNLSQIAVLEGRVGYEKKLGRHVVGLEAAYKPDIGDESISLVIVGYNSKEPYWSSTSYSVFINYKYFLSKKERVFMMFIDTKLMGRYMEYTDKYHSQYNPKESQPSQIESGYRSIYGGFLLCGTRFYFNRSGSIFVDVHAGLSGRITYMNTTVKSTCTLYSQRSDCDYKHLMAASDDSKPYEKEITLEPAPQVGVKLGVAF